MVSKEIVILMMVGLLLMGCTNTTSETSEGTSAGMPVPSDIDSIAPEAVVVKTFTITGENFKFMHNGQENPELHVQKGDTVRIEFSSIDGFHDWMVDEFGATEKVRPGTPTMLEFVAENAGTYEYYCSVGSHREMGMKGILIVE